MKGTKVEVVERTHPTNGKSSFHVVDSAGRTLTAYYIKARAERYAEACNKRLSK